MAYVARPIEDAIGKTYQWGRAWATVSEGPLQRVRRILTPIAGGILRVGKASLWAADFGLQAFWRGLVIGWTGLKKLGSLTVSAIGYLGGLTKNLLFFGTIAVGIGSFALYNVAKGATSLAEQSDRAAIVFGSSAKLIIDQSKLMGDAFGVSRREFIQAASAFGTIFQGVGYTDDAAVQLSVHFVKLATDLSSLVHIPVEEAMQKIQSGLTGQVRPLREVGVFMSEEVVKAYAVAHGIAKMNTELTESQKVQARVGFITEALAKANGNLAKTAEGAGNSARGLAGRFENLKDSIGTTLLQFIVPILNEANIGLMALQTAWGQSGLAAKDESIGVLGGADKQVQAIGFLQSSIMYVADAWRNVKLVFLQVVGSTTTGIANMLTNLQKFVDQVGFLAPGLKQLVGNSIGEAGKQMQAVADKQLAGFLTELNKPLPSVGISKAFDDARKKIDDARKALEDMGILDVNKFAPEPTVAPLVKNTGLKFAEAMRAGSKEAANIELRARFGGTGKTAQDQTAANTKKANEYLAKIAQAVQIDVRGGKNFDNIGWNF